jgi:hypothetical protein
MTWLVIESAATLMWCVAIVRFRGLASMCSKLKRMEVSTGIQSLPIDTLCHAVASAAVFLPLQLSSSERAATLAILLRRHGWTARFVLGAQVLPPELYAWVEIDKRVIGDSSDLRAIYRVLVLS